MTVAQIVVVVALVWMIVALVSNKIPFGAIALSIPLIFVIGGVYEKPIQVMSQLTSPSFLLIASIMILCQGMFESGLAMKIGELLLKLTGGRKSETIILVMVIIIATIMTMFLPNTGVATILLPICIAVSIASGVSRSETSFVMISPGARTLDVMLYGAPIAANPRLIACIADFAAAYDSIRSFGC